MASRKLNLGLPRFSGLYLGALFIAIFGLWKPDLFFTSATLHSIAAQQAVVALIAFAILVPLVGGTYDLSVGATANLCGILVAVLQVNHGWSLWAAIVLSVAVGAVVGLVNAFVILKLHVNSFIATLGTGWIIAAIQTMVSSSQPAPPTTAAWNNLTGASVGGFQIVVIYMLVIGAIIAWGLTRTPQGRFLYAIGGNSEAARLSGVRVNRYVGISVVVSGSVAAIAGILYTSQNGPSLDFGTALLLPAFAAAFLGSTQIYPGRFNVPGTVIAIYVLAIGVRGLEFVTSQQWINDMFNGVALIGAVAFAIWRQGRSPRMRRTTPQGSRELEVEIEPVVEVAAGSEVTSEP